MVLLATGQLCWSILDAPTRVKGMILLVLIILGTVLEGIGIASVFVLISVINDIESISKFGMLQNIADWLELEGSSLVVYLSIAIAGFVLGKNAYLYLVIRYRARFVNDGIARNGSSEPRPALANAAADEQPTHGRCPFQYPSGSEIAVWK